MYIVKYCYIFLKNEKIKIFRGHGTYVRDGEIVSSLSGVVQQLNRLLMVKTIKQRYAGEVGDVVVARVVEVQAKRWKVSNF